MKIDKSPILIIFHWNTMCSRNKHQQQQCSLQTHHGRKARVTYAIAVENGERDACKPNQRRRREKQKCKKTKIERDFTFNVAFSASYVSVALQRSHKRGHIRSTYYISSYFMRIYFLEISFGYNFFPLRKRRFFSFVVFFVFCFLIYISFSFNSKF